jgi:hypothetical protein
VKFNSIRAKFENAIFVPEVMPKIGMKIIPESSYYLISFINMRLKNQKVKWSCQTITLVEKLEKQLSEEKTKKGRRRLKNAINFYSSPLTKDFQCPKCHSNIIHEDYNHYSCSCREWKGPKEVAKLFRLLMNDRLEEKPSPT